MMRSTCGHRNMRLKINWALSDSRNSAVIIIEAWRHRSCTVAQALALYESPT